MEATIFKKSKVDITKLIDYGFSKENNLYKYSKYFMNNKFIAEIVIDSNGNIKSKVIDVDMMEEYIGLRTNNYGKFATKVREEYKKILIDIRDNCFINNNFIFDQSNRVYKYIQEKYKTKLEFLWEKYPGYGVLRHNTKWYAIIMNIDKSKLDKNCSGEIEIINLKINPNDLEKLLSNNGFYKAYHMNKKSWITIVLDNSVNDELIFELIDNSYNLINS